MTTSKESPMGDLIRFPRPRTSEQPEVDGTAAPAATDHTENSNTAAATPQASESGAELVPDTDSREVTRRTGVVPPVLAGRMTHAWEDLREHGWEYTKTSGKFLARHSIYLLGGAWDTTSSLYSRWTGRDIDEQIAAARAAGEHGVVADLLRQRTENKKLLLERLQVWAKFLAKLPIALGGLAALGLGITLIASIVALIRPGGLGFAQVWDGLFTALAGGFEWTVWALTVPAPLLLLASAFGLLVQGYNHRRHAQNAPDWAQPLADGTEGRGVIPDEGAILEALRHLGLGPLDKAFKAGWATAGHPAKVWEQPTARDGKGWRTQLRLPQGVTVDMVNRKKSVLAHNLVRTPVEVWPTEPKGKPGVLDLWVADQGALSGPVDPWPLLASLDAATADYFAGVPVGVNIRGDQVRARLFEANYAVAGMMGSGKSTLVITLLLGAMLDPLVDIDVFVMAQNADYEPMKPRLRTLVTGAGDATAAACMETLRELYADLETRGQALKEHDARAVSRELAEQDDRLRPRIAVIDECQALFMHPEFGEEAADLVAKLIAAARKYAVTLVFLTPEPSTASLPRKVVTVCSNKACFAIGDQQSNDAILGTGSYTAGISAVGLEPKTDEGPGDIGTAMTRGFFAKPGLLRSYYIPQADARRVTDRAVQLREDAHITTTPSSTHERDVLTDVLAVMGTERARASEVAATLGSRWAHYQGWGIKRLVAALADEGVKVPNPGNVPTIDPNTVRNSKARREATDPDAE